MPFLLGLKICSQIEVMNSCCGSFCVISSEDSSLKKLKQLQAWPGCFVLRCCWRCSGFMSLVVGLGGLQLVDANSIKAYYCEFCQIFVRFGFTFFHFLRFNRDSVVLVVSDWQVMRVGTARLGQSHWVESLVVCLDQWEDVELKHEFCPVLFLSRAPMPLPWKKRLDRSNFL